jgi:hypothetical protein
MKTEYISQLMLELYHLGAATRKERKLIDKAIKIDNNIRLRYEELKKKDNELKTLDKNKFTIIKNENYTDNILIRKKKVIWLAGIAAVLICTITFTIINRQKLNNSSFNKIAEEQNNIINNIDINDDKIIDIAENIIIESDTINTETRNENEHIFENLHINETHSTTIAEIPNTDHEVYPGENPDIPPSPILSMRASGDSLGYYNIYIPSGVTTIIENMFEGLQLDEVYIPRHITNIEKNAFANSTIIEINIGADIDVHDEAFPGNFASVYNENGRERGLYFRQDTSSHEWKKF